MQDPADQLALSARSPVSSEMLKPTAVASSIERFSSNTLTEVLWSITMEAEAGELTTRSTAGLTLICTVIWLLPRLSSTSALTITSKTPLPTAAALLVTVTVRPLPPRTSPSTHLIVPAPLVQAATDDDAEIKDKLFGNVASTATLVACVVPLLVTSKVTVTLLPSSGVGG